MLTNDQEGEAVVDAAAARTGGIAEGKVWVQPVDRVVGIRTGVEGPAVGSGAVVRPPLPSAASATGPVESRP